jgi:peptidoglycan/xylan/chitin deacetylase (PgdA/CDA1 family)
MYHSISDEPENGVHPYYRLNTSPKRFTQQMKFLSDNNYHVLSLSEAANLLNQPINQLPNQPIPQSSPHPINGSPNQPVNFIVITFDDGFRDFLEYAWPVLSDFRQTATVFLPTDFIGANRRSFNNRECLIWPEVRELYSQGVSFGSHTASHPKLYGFPWKDVQREMRESRLQIEDELHAPATCFSYPYAFPREDREFVQHFAKELVDQGYRTAVTTIVGRAGRRSEPLRLERLPINDSDDQGLFEAKLAGAYDWVACPQFLARRLKSSLRIVRPANTE